jgi:hypothetical protein
MEINDQLHTVGTLPMWNEPPVRIEEEVGCASFFSVCDGEKKIPDFIVTKTSAEHPIACHFTDDCHSS